MPHRRLFQSPLIPGAVLGGEGWSNNFNRVSFRGPCDSYVHSDKAVKHFPRLFLEHLIGFFWGVHAPLSCFSSNSLASGPQGPECRRAFVQYIKLFLPVTRLYCSALSQRGRSAQGHQQKAQSLQNFRGLLMPVSSSATGFPGTGALFWRRT